MSVGAAQGASRIRVVLVTHYFPAHSGGVERVAGELASRLVRNGTMQIEWHASECDLAPPDTPGVKCLPARSCNAIERFLGFPYPLWSPGALWRVARAARRADVVHLHDCLYLPNLVAYAAARLARRPVLVTQHVGFVPYRSSVLRAMLAAANRIFGSVVLGGATQVVFESDTVRRYFLRFVRFRAEPLLVPNGVDTGEFTPAASPRRQSLRAELGARDGRPLLLFLGRFVEKKGLAVLRELTERIPHAQWVIAGWGPLDPAAWGRQNVTVVHRPGSDQLAPLYQAADLLVLPSVGEGFPLSVQEAMACGTPALVGDETAAGCPESQDVLLREAVGAQDTAARWAGRIEGLLASPATLETLRPRVAEFARARWSWEKCAGRYSGILHGIRNGQ
ncbi:MAG TPA: glycosyltransferase family 4 protein [Burkholderiales bacterium]|nr:glycosyltransferase family 4 protein [Burkholderiales bacterium]